MLPLPAPSVIYQRLDDGAVLFDPETEIYFGLNAVGAAVWELLPPASDSLDALCERLRTEYPDVEHGVIRADVTELLGQLLQEGLVLPPPASSAGAVADR